jgi:hypothetical protein
MTDNSSHIGGQVNSEEVPSVTSSCGQCARLQCPQLTMVERCGTDTRSGWNGQLNRKSKEKRRKSLKKCNKSVDVVVGRGRHSFADSRRFCLHLSSSHLLLLASAAAAGEKYETPDEPSPKV